MKNEKSDKKERKDEKNEEEEEEKEEEKEEETKEVLKEKDPWGDQLHFKPEELFVYDIVSRGLYSWYVTNKRITKEVADKFIEYIVDYGVDSEAYHYKRLCTLNNWSSTDDTKVAQARLLQHMREISTRWKFVSPKIKTKTVVVPTSVEKITKTTATKKKHKFTATNISAKKIALIGSIWTALNSYRCADVYRIVGFTRKFAIVESVPVSCKDNSGRVNTTWLEKNKVDPTTPPVLVSTNTTLLATLYEDGEEDEIEDVVKDEAQSICVKGAYAYRCKNPIDYSFHWCDY